MSGHLFETCSECPACQNVRTALPKFSASQPAKTLSRRHQDITGDGLVRTNVWLVNAWHIGESNPKKVATTPLWSVSQQFHQLPADGISTRDVRERANTQKRFLMSFIIAFSFCVCVIHAAYQRGRNSGRMRFQQHHSAQFTHFFFLISTNSIRFNSIKFKFDCGRSAMETTARSMFHEPLIY